MCSNKGLLYSRFLIFERLFTKLEIPVALEKTNSQRQSRRSI
jgi:hypothetical protein